MLNRSGNGRIDSLEMFGLGVAKSCFNLGGATRRLIPGGHLRLPGLAARNLSITDPAQLRGVGQRRLAQPLDETHWIAERSFRRGEGRDRVDAIQWVVVVRGIELRVNRLPISFEQSPDDRQRFGQFQHATGLDHRQTQGGRDPQILGFRKQLQTPRAQRLPIRILCGGELGLQLPLHHAFKLLKAGVVVKIVSARFRLADRLQ